MTAEARVLELEAAIRKVCSQRLDDLCWMDLYELAEVADCPMPDLTLLPKEVMLGNCDKYVTCLMACPADKEQALAVYRRCKRQTTNDCM